MTQTPFSINEVIIWKIEHYDLENKRIALKEGMSQAQTLKKFVHELAHSRIHNLENLKDKDKRTIEVEAESIAFVVSKHFNLDASSYSFGYIALWSKDKELNELKKYLNTIQNESNAIIAEVNKNLEKDKSVGNLSVKDKLKNIDDNKNNIKSVQNVKSTKLER